MFIINNKFEDKIFKRHHTSETFFIQTAEYIIIATILIAQIYLVNL